VNLVDTYCLLSSPGGCGDLNPSVWSGVVGQHLHELKVQDMKARLFRFATSAVKSTCRAQQSPPVACLLPPGSKLPFSLRSSLPPSLPIHISLSSARTPPRAPPAFGRAHKQIREKELENNKLSEYVQDLAVSVAQREKIVRVRRSEDQSTDDREYKMQEVVWRRLVLEVSCLRAYGRGSNGESERMMEGVCVCASLSCLVCFFVSSGGFLSGGDAH